MPVVVLPHSISWSCNVIWHGSSKTINQFKIWIHISKKVDVTKGMKEKCHPTSMKKTLKQTGERFMNKWRKYRKNNSELEYASLKTTVHIRRKQWSHASLHGHSLHSMYFSSSFFPHRRQVTVISLLSPYISPPKWKNDRTFTLPWWWKSIQFAEIHLQKKQ